MSKNKNKDKDKDKAEGGAPRARKERKPMGPLPERICEKADRVHAMAKDVAELTAKRAAPGEVVEMAKTFLGQVEAWREKLIALKASGWVPADKSLKVDIVEGDLIKFIDEPKVKEAYSYIPGVTDGTAQLVAGAVIQVNRFLVNVMVKTPEGTLLGYVPRKFLTGR